MSKVIFISDYFIDEITGGAEFCNNALIEGFLSKEHEVLKIKSSNVNLDFLNRNKSSFFIIANFMQIHQDHKNFFTSQGCKYIIYEHDHKYLKSNNPALFSNFLANEDQIQNLDFYNSAIAVLCQSLLHTKIVYKNTLLKNIINLGGNFWTNEQIQILKNNIKSEDEKDIENVIYNSKNPNKGTPQTIAYCNKNNIKFSFLENADYQEFIENLSRCKKLFFFPTWVETFNRFVIEAKILNCKIVTNNFIGCSSEGILNLNGLDLLNEIQIRMKNIYNIFDNLISGNLDNVRFYSEPLPRITIMSTFVDGEIYLEQFLQEITKQTIFEEVDFYLVDAGSNGREREIINKYTAMYSNISYIRTEERISIPAAFNLVLEETKNEFISMIQIDDRPSIEYCSTLRKHLLYSEKVDLVYGDCLQTNRPNETVDKNSSNSFYEHSLPTFTKENMIKCLPGPMPMFRKSMIQKNGTFKNDLIYSNDWELWLRCVRGGSKFKKVNTIVGLYYFNPSGKSTSPENAKNKLQEERIIFNEYIDVIGQKNYNIYKDYFNREI